MPSPSSLFQGHSDNFYRYSKCPIIFKQRNTALSCLVYLFGTLVVTVWFSWVTVSVLRLPNLRILRSVSGTRDVLFGICAGDRPTSLD